MALSKSLVQPYRKNQLLLGSGWRAFFAPFNIAYAAGTFNSALGPKILDLQYQGPFDTNNPPAGWYDLGWIKDYKMTPSTKIGQIKTGYRGATRQQIRGEIGEQFEFKFREFTRMAFKIATGSQIYNLLKVAGGSSTGPLSSSATTYALGASGYQASGAGTVAGSPAVFVASGQSSAFSVGDMIVVDVDYDKSTTGFVGSNGIPVLIGAAPQDVDFIRKTSDFVGRIASITTNAVSGQDALVLTQPFMGGGSSASSLSGPVVPPAGSKIQKITGIAAREGGTYITEWSALFVLDTIDGDQFAQYYPHVSISQFKDIPNWAINNIGNTDLSGYELDATLESLAFDDPLDGETVVCYRAFYPSSGTSDIAI